ncbi:MAG TPA: response regulator transcription factor [Gemmatimonadales bacterium]|nr:response regulator transcription factor [Gemmatimonadales bacterium]
MPKTVAVLVIEDNRLLRDGIAAMVAEQPALKLVAAVEGADAGLRLARETSPQVVLVDAGLGDHDSHRLVASLKKAAPEAGVIVMDLLPLPEDIVDFVKAGASGFILKDATVESFVGTIRSVARGERVLPGALTESLFSHIAEQAAGRAATEVIEAVRMTQREREVFQLIADGLSNKEIAQRIHVATNTVKGHVHNILEKLALHTRLQIATYAHARETEARSS